MTQDYDTTVEANQKMSKREYDRLLNEHFGHKELKKEQYEIIKTVVEDRRDVCAVLATGFGKSVCYQLPLLITGKSVLVVSPLISLMQDQKTRLESLGI